MARSRSRHQAEGASGIAEPAQVVGSDVEVQSGGESAEEPLARALRGRTGHEVGSAVPFAEWQRGLVAEMKGRSTFTDFGQRMLKVLSGLDTPLGNFVRSYCSHVQPPPATVAAYERKGDLLPIHPTSIKAGENGGSAENLEWVQLTFSMLNFNYCTGWTKAICVPMDTRLSANQKAAISEVASTIDANIVGTEVLPSLG